MISRPLGESIGPPASVEQTFILVGDLLHQEMPGWKAAITSFTKSGGYASLRERIAGVKHPTLIFWGEADDVLGIEDARKFEQAILNSQLIWIPKAGHAPHFERP
ncbi:alpha/beta hydrolase [Ancylothrix sp. C2]|uniref:alpha/beta fold hydrolase n=1 Tax=Ancylothrix sp. D3o TaxID=2953691 RepID=UPI0021BA8744|nr:alpha/beta hydrolase [Ancylothrix sp. D3o]MCT7952238.1 alpha/beta hydrolase [Ancylothrix sp. D3o]